MSNPIEEMIKKLEGLNEVEIDPGEHLKLKKLHGQLCEKYGFKVGDLVEWKPGLKNKSNPYGKPLIVTKVYDEPITHTDKDTGNPYYREALDIVCAELQDGAFLEYHYDSRRFQPYSPEQSADG